MQTETTRNSRHSFIAIFFAILGVCAVGITGCSTIEGAGEDLEYVGESMSGASRDVQN